jgi:hypothetical protein
MAIGLAATDPRRDPALMNMVKCCNGDNMLATRKSIGGRRWPPMVTGGHWWILVDIVLQCIPSDPPEIGGSFLLVCHQIRLAFAVYGWRTLGNLETRFRSIWSCICRYPPSPAESTGPPLTQLPPKSTKSQCFLLELAGDHWWAEVVVSCPNADTMIAQ